MKSILIILFLSILIIGCETKVSIPEGRIESVEYPDMDLGSGVFTNSEWKTFYVMKERSYLTPEGFLEKRMAVVDSFQSPTPLEKEDAKKLAISADAKIENIHYSTEESLPSWKKNLSFNKKIIRRYGYSVIFEEENGQTEMTYVEFLEKSGLLFLMVVFVILCLVRFLFFTINILEKKKSRKILFYNGFIVWALSSFLLSFWADAFKAEIILTIFSTIFFTIILGIFINFVFKRIIERIFSKILIK